MGSPLTVERYAEVRAEMETGRLRDHVLAQSGISTAEWIAAQREWLERMGAELELGRLELANRYSQAFVERQRALEASGRVASAPPPELDRAAAARVSSLPPPPGARLSEPPAPLAPMPTPLQVRRSEPPAPLAPLPTPLQVRPSEPPAPLAPMPTPLQARPSEPPPVHYPASPSRASSEPPPLAFNQTLTDAVTVPRQALPFRKQDPAARALSPPPTPSRTQPGGGDTLSAVKPAERTVLPFREAPAASPPPAGASGEKPEFGSTLFVSPEEHAALRARLVTPFGGGGASAARPSPAVEAPPAGERVVARSAPAAAPAAPKRNATVAIDVSKLVAVALPFGAKPAHGPAIAGPARPAGSSAAVAPSATPPVPVPQLTVEQYASLLEDLGESQEPARVLARYSLSAEQRTVLDNHWHKRLLAEPELAGRVAQARATYRAWKQGRRS